MAATLTCLQCGSDLEEGDRYCAACGVESFRCASCSQQLLPTDLTCPHCGTTAEHPAAGSAPAPDEGSDDLGDIIGRLRRATLGEFDIGRELGRGGMAAVFLAHDIALDRKVAIKVMSPGLMLGDGMVERFKQEAITIAQLHHPSIVSVYSVRQADGLHFFVMRYVQGRSLEQVLQQARRLPLPIVRSVLYQVGSALAYAHRSRVVHRDIKPANILIDEDGNAVVTDFGIAKAAERPTQTLTGALVGTPAYMSPEQCAGSEVSGASDQYSLGVVAYEMLTGEPPFSGSSLTVMQAHVEREPRGIRELNGECPPEVEAAIRRMLSKDPDARWPRMADALTALGAEALPEEHPLRGELSRHATGAVSTVSSSPTPRSPAPRTRASGAGSGPWRVVGGITIMPAPAALEVGDSFTLVAVIRGQHGTRLPPRAVEWSTDSPGVLRVDGPGAMATALAPGTALVTARCKSVTARLRVDVAAPRADDIVIEPMTEPLHAGEEVRLDATARDKRGWPVYRPVNWLSADAQVADVTPDGAIAGRAPGTVRITAALDDARASIVIPVLPPRVAGVDIADPPAAIVVGQTVTLKGTPVDRSNTPLPGRPILWSTSDANVVEAAEDGAVTGTRPGSAVLTATCEGVRAMIRLRVVAAEPAAVTTPLVPRRRSRRARRRAMLAFGVALTGGAAWIMVRPAPLPDRGAAAPSAYVDGGVAIDTSPAAGIVITRRPLRSLRPDSVAALAAEVHGADGRIISGAEIVWSSSDSTIARVDRATGRLRGLRPGRVFVAAASRGARDSVLISVRRPGARLPAVAQVTEPSDSEPPAVEVAAPAAPEAVPAIQILGARPMAVQETLALRVAATDGQSDLTHAPISWTSNDSSVADVDEATGTVVGRMPGTVTISADAGGSTAWTRLTVLPRPARLRSAGDAERPETRVIAGVEECYGAVQSKDLIRLRAMWRPEPGADLNRLHRLERVLRNLGATVGERVDRAPKIGPESASFEFGVPLTWRESGALRTAMPAFRAEFVRTAGRWDLTTCRIVSTSTF